MNVNLAADGVAARVAAVLVRVEGAVAAADEGAIAADEGAPTADELDDRTRVALCKAAIVGGTLQTLLAVDANTPAHLRQYREPTARSNQTGDSPTRIPRPGQCRR